MSIKIINPAVPVTDQAILDQIAVFMVDKHSVTGAAFIAGVPLLQGKPRNEQEQAVQDAGMQYIEMP